MQSIEDDLIKNYIPAPGPEGLKQVLEDLLDKSKNDPAFAGKEHFIYYHVGEQKSLIKVDMSEKPYLFWYFDLLGRPATKAVKKIVGDFLWERCGEKAKYLREAGFEE